MRIVSHVYCVVVCVMCVVEEKGNEGGKNVWDSSKCSWKCLPKMASNSRLLVFPSRVRFRTGLLWVF